jgi:hypothetical protein
MAPRCENDADAQARKIMRLHAKCTTVKSVTTVSFKYFISLDYMFLELSHDIIFTKKQALYFYGAFLLHKNYHKDNSIGATFRDNFAELSATV